MYRGFYINLDSNTPRRSAFERHLVERGAAGRYERIEAVNGRQLADQYTTTLDPGNLGLWLSHKKLLAGSHPRDAHWHVVEDDAVFCQNAVNQFDDMLDIADAKLGDWDLVFTDIHVNTSDIGMFKMLAAKMQLCQQHKGYTLVDLEQIPFACTSSFFINRQAIDKYATALADNWSQGVPIDLYLRGLVQAGKLKAYLTVPFLTSVSPDTLQSDIRGDVSGSRAVATLYRQAFFIDADLPSLYAQLEALTRQAAPASPLTAIFLRMLLFRVSEHWLEF